MGKEHSEGYNKLIEQYIKQSPEIAGAMISLLDRLWETEERLELSKKTMGIVSHDVMSPLSAIKGLSNRGISRKLPEEKVKEYFRTINSSANVIGETMSLIDLFYEDKGEHEEVPILDLAETHIRSIEHYLIAEKVGFYLKSGEMQGPPAPTIRRNKPAVASIIRTLMGNGLDYAATNSKIKMGIREDPRNSLLEIIAETKWFRKERNLFGKGTGQGMPFITKLISGLGGTLYVEQDSEKEIDITYKKCEKFGDWEKGATYDGAKIYRAEVKIPLKNI